MYRSKTPQKKSARLLAKKVGQVNTLHTARLKWPSILLPAHQRDKDTELVLLPCVADADGAVAFSMPGGSQAAALDEGNASSGQGGNMLENVVRRVGSLVLAPEAWCWCLGRVEPL